MKSFTFATAILLAVAYITYIYSSPCDIMGNVPTFEEIEGMDDTCSNIPGYLALVENLYKKESYNREIEKLLALLHYKTSKYKGVYDPGSVFHFLQAIQIIEKLSQSGDIPDNKIIDYYARSAGSLSYIYYNVKENVYQAMQYSEKAVEMCTRFGKPIPYKVRMNYGMLLEEIGDYHRALQEYSSALSSAEKDPGPNSIEKKQAKARVWLSMSSALCKIGEAEKAEANLREAFPFLERVDYYVYYENLAKTYEYRSQFENARAEYLNALKYCEERKQYWIVYLGLSRNERLNNNLSASKKYAEQTLKYADNIEQKSAALDALGEIALSDSKPELALNYFKSAQDTLLYFKSGYQAPKAEIIYKTTYFNLVFDEARALYQVPGKEKAALTAFTVADSMLYYIRQEHEDEESKLGWRKGTRKLYELAIDVCYRVKDYSSAFYFFERSKSVLLQDALNSLDASKILGSDLADLQFSLQKKLTDARIAHQENPDPATLQAVLIAQDSLRLVVKKIESQSPDYAQLKYRNNTLNLDEAIDHLDKNSSILHFFWGDSSAYLLKISQTGAPVFRKIDHTENLSTVINEFAGMSSGRLEMNKSKFFNQGNFLYRELVAPCFPEPFSNDHTAIIVPDGPVASIPFDALITKSVDKAEKLPDWSGATWLLHELQTQLAFSCTALWSHSDNGSDFSNNRPLQLALFAPIQYSNGLSALNGGLQLDASLQTTIGHPGYRPFLNEKSTKEEFLEQQIKYSIVHVHTHVTEDSIRHSLQLHMANAAIEMEDFYHINSNADLFVVGSCISNTGVNHQGEGVFSINRALSIAGVKSTVSSLWEVPEPSTVPLMSYFYEEINQGYSLASALRRAKQRFIKNHLGEENMPANWAAWSFYGKDTIFEIKSDKNYWVAIGGILFGFSILWRVWYWRKRRQIITPP